MHTKVKWENLKGKYHVGDMGIGWRIILKCRVLGYVLD